MVRLTESREKLLAILPIPSAILSVFGSSMVIMMSMKSYGKKQNSWTPYSRLLVAMSLYDIQSSITFGAATFLRPRDTSTSLWAMGDNATCVAVGFLNTIGFSSVFFQGMLSIYFVLRTKFGYSDERMAKRVEPIMHAIAIGYPLLSAIVGLSLNLYGELTSGLSCWVKDVPTDCGTGEGQSGLVCSSNIFSWLFYAVPTFVASTCLIGNSVVLFLFIWKHTRKLGPSKLSDSIRCYSGKDRLKISDRTNYTRRNSSLLMMSQDEKSTSENKQSESRREDEDDDSVAEIDKYEDTELEKQRRRMKLLGSQALLFVVSYAMCNIWTAIMLLEESGAQTQQEEDEMMVRYYSIAILQAIFYPLQGFCNMLVYVRPKYLSFRYGNPDESRFSVAKLVVFGEDGETSHPMEPRSPSRRSRKKVGAPSVVNNKDSSLPIRNMREIDAAAGDRGVSSPNPRPRNMISSITVGSLEDLKSPTGDENNDPRWGRAEEVMDNKPPQRSSNRFHSSLRSSQLEVISELSVSIFESIATNTESLNAEGSETHIEPISPNRSQGCRWGTTQRRNSDLPPTVAMGLDISDRTQQVSNRFEAQGRHSYAVSAPSRIRSEMDPPSDSEDASSVSSIGSRSLDRPKGFDISDRTKGVSNRFHALARIATTTPSDAPVVAPFRMGSEMEPPLGSEDASVGSVDIPIRPPTRRLSPTPPTTA